MHLDVAKRINPGNTVILTFDMPENNSHIKIWAEVTWTKKKPDEKTKYEMGVKFISISDRQRKALMDYVDQINANC